MSIDNDEFFRNDIKFIKEQNGDEESVLKKEYENYYIENKIDCLAYLMRVEYDNVPAFNVAMCLKIESKVYDDHKENLSKIFTNRYSENEHLDFIVLSDKLYEQIQMVGSPFFRGQN